MLIKPDDLCYSCRQIPCEGSFNGMSLEEAMNIVHDDRRGLNDDEINSMFFHHLYNYKDIHHCTRCWQLFFDNIPSSMGGNM